MDANRYQVRTNAVLSPLAQIANKSIDLENNLYFIMNISNDSVSLLVKFTQNHEEASSLLGKIANRLALSKSDQYTLQGEENLSIVPSEILTLEDNMVRFKDEFTFRFFWSFHIIDQILKLHLHEPDTLIEKLTVYIRENRFRRKLDGIEQVVFLVLNRMYQVNVLRYVELEAKYDFWLIYQNICDLMHLLDLQPKAIIAGLQVIVQKTQEAGGAGLAYKAIKSLCAARPDIGYNLFEELRKEENNAIKWFIPNALLGLSETEDLEKIYPFTYDYLCSTNSDFAQIGIAACGKFQYASHPQLLRQTINQFDKFLQANNDASILEELVSAYEDLLDQYPDGKERIYALSEKQLPEIQYQVSRVLWMNAKKYFSETWFENAFLNLSGVSIENKGIIHYIKFCFNEVLDQKPTLAWTFLSNWIINHADNRKSLSVFEHELLDLKNDPSLLEENITKWFNDDNPLFHFAAAYLVETLHKHKKSDFALSASVLQHLGFPDLEFVTSKILGYVYPKEALCELIFSLLKVAGKDQRVYSLVVSSFNGYVAYNYPSVQDFLVLKAKTGSAIEKEAATAIIEHIENYFQAKSALKHLQELKPPEGRVAAFAKVKSKSFGSLSEKMENSESSIFSMVKKIDLKAGKTYFSKVDGSYSKPSSLGYFQVKSEMPRGEFIDPILQMRLRYQWRTYQRRK